MRLSMREAVTLRQELRQQLTLEQRLELRQELKLALELVQELIQKLELGQVITINEVKRCFDAIHSVPVMEWRQLANRMPATAARGLATVIEWGSKFDGWCKENRALARVLRKNVPAPKQREPRLALQLAMRLAIRNPRWFGGCSGHPYNLAQLLKRIPQRSDSGHILWVLAGGWAVELITRANVRGHHDIDTLILCGRPLNLDTDVVEPENYFNVLSCSSNYILRNCVKRVTWSYKDDVFEVDVVKPEFLFCSKFIRPPRPQDWTDVTLLVQTFASTWNIRLISAIAKRNCCGFTRGHELQAILATRDPEKILAKLLKFHDAQPTHSAEAQVD